MNKGWKINPNGTAESHWVDVMSEWEEDDSHWWHASIKWEGCIHLNHAGNSPFNKYQPHTKKEDQDYFHICDLSAHIKKLQALEKFAKEYFKDREWGNE